MINIFLCGYSGAMGKAVLECAAKQKDIKVSDYTAKRGNCAVDVLLDFSHPDALADLLEYAKKSKTPLVLATTGYSKEQVAEIEETAKTIPILRSANFSVVTYKFAKSVADFARCWDGDIEIVETHHNQKKDAPSGTALVLANAILTARRGVGRIVIGRTTESGKRMPGDIGVTSVRGGIVPGLHEVRFYNESCETFMSVREYGRMSFALGALEACRLLAKSAKPGIYTMDDLVK